MDVRASDDYYHFIYDPQLYGFNTAYWRELNGTASLTATNKIRANSVTIASKHQYFRGDVTLAITVPAVPGGGLRQWGFISPVLGTSKNAAFFQITAGIFQAVVINNDGTQTTYNITWNSNWTSTEVEYRIHWTKGKVEFYADGVKVASFEDRNTVPGYLTLPVMVKNENADNLDLAYVLVSYSEKVVKAEWEVPVTAAPSTDTKLVEGASDSITVTDVPTVTATQLGGIDVSDVVTVTESVTVFQIVLGAGAINDAITVTESVTVELLPHMASVNDTITVTESVSVSV